MDSAARTLVSDCKLIEVCTVQESLEEKEDSSIFLWLRQLARMVIANKNEVLVKVFIRDFFGKVTIRNSRQSLI